MTSSMRRELAKFLPAGAILPDSALGDWPRGSFPPGAVLAPFSEAQVAQVMARASQEGWRVLPAGLCSWLDGGGTPEVDLVLSTGNLRELGSYESADLTFTADVEASKRLNRMPGPVVVISASGMCEGGRILHHLKHSVDDERNAILIVGYQAQHTLGRRLVERKSPIKIYGQRYQLRARVHTVNALSAHADRKELNDYFRAMGPKVDCAFVVHGEPDASAQLARDLESLGAREVVVPEPGDAFTP